MRVFLRICIPLLVVLAAAVAFIRPGGERESIPGPGASFGKRAGQIPNDWFYAQRAYPYEQIPAAAYRRAREQARALRDARGEPASGKNLNNEWSLVGPSNIGGRITAIGSHESTPQLVYIGAADGGVWKSTDSGVSWSPIFDGVGSQSIGALTVAPYNADVIVVGTGEANASGDSYDGDGVYRSNDGGESWFPLGLEQTRRIGRIALDPIDISRMYVAAAGPLFTKDGNRGIYRTTNLGNTWERTLFVSDSTSAIDVVVEPGNPANVYAAMWERLRRPYDRSVGGVTSGIYKSTDYGATWSLLTNGLPSGSNVGRIGLSASVSSPGTLVAIYADDPGFFLGLYKSTNGGASWNQMNDGALSGLYSSFGWYFGNVRIDPTDVNRIFCLGVPLYRTTNGGNSWSSVGGSVHVDHHALWIDPLDNTRVYNGNDGGAFRSQNGGSAWTESFNLPITQFYAIAVDFQNPTNRRYGGTQDNGTMRTTTGSLDDWDVIYGGDGFYCLIDPTNSNVIYAEYQYGGLGKSTNDGGSFSGATSGINSGDRRNWSTPVQMDPNNPQVLYYGTYRVYRSANGASSWSAISGDLTNGPSPGGLTYGTITTIAVAESDPSTIYAGTDDGNVSVTTNLGGSWTNVSGSLPERWVTRVAVDPNNDAIGYVTFSGYREDEFMPHVFRTTNHGASWTDISGNLPEAPVNEIVIDPASTSTLIVGTDVGVYISYDLGANWTPLGYGLPDAVMSDLVFDPTNRTLYGGTHGRSILAIDVPASPTTVGPRPNGVAALQLGLPSPNPARRGVRIELALAQAGAVEAAVYDAAGRRVRDLGRSVRAAGSHAIGWDRADDAGRRAAAGVYFLRVEAGPRVATRKITLVD